MTPRKLAIIIGAIVTSIILLFVIFVIGLFSSPDADELNRQALVAEGKSLTADMEQANRDHNSSRVSEIREREAAFRRRSDEYLAKHGRPRP